MKRIILISMLLIFKAINSYCLDPVRISTSTTPNTTANLTIDLLKDDGTLLSNVYSESNKSSGTSGIISVIIQGGYWAESGYSKDYLVKVTFGTTTLLIERLEVVIAEQSLYGATISSDDIDQTNQVAFKALALSGDLNVSGTTTANKLVGNIYDVSMSTNAYTVDFSNINTSTLMIHVNGSPDNISDVLTLSNPTEGQVLFVFYSNSGGQTNDRLKLNTGTTQISNDRVVIMTYMHSNWYYNTLSKY